MASAFASERAASRAINKAFRSRGLSLRAAAAQAVRDHVDGADDPAVELARLVVMVKEKGLRSTLVDAEAVRDVVAVLAGRACGVETDAPARVLEHGEVRVVSAFELPRFVYSTVRRVLTVSHDRRPLHGQAGDKAEAFRERYAQALQRTSRHLRHDTDGALRVTMIKSLLGSPGPKLIFGMLTQITEGRWYVEDLNSYVPVDLSAVAQFDGLFTEGCMVLAQGELADGVFYVREMAHPPAEERRKTLENFANADLFGLPGYQPRDRALLAELDAAAGEELMVVLSDVHLDSARVLQRLHTLLSGLELSRPAMFVLCGNFTSRPYGAGSGDSAQYRRLFDALGKLLAGFPELAENAHFVLVPGPTDPGVSSAMPRHPLLPLFTDGVRARVKRLTVTTNPCRILFYSREVVIFREDLLQKMRRNCLALPSSRTADEHLVQTVLGQGHLCPLPPLVRPTYWTYEHAMRIYPLPDALILADSVDQFEWQHHGCDVVNPGSFATDFSFVVYKPCGEATPGRVGGGGDDDGDDDDDGDELSRVEFSRIE